MKCKVQHLYPYSGRGNCSDGAIQLVGGETELEGRVEFCMDGVFGTVCDSDWVINDATVICRQLRFAQQGELLCVDHLYQSLRFVLVFKLAVSVLLPGKVHR